MNTITVNGKVYKFGKSTWYSDHGALFISFDGGLKFTVEHNCHREWDYIKSDPDNYSAYKQLEKAALAQ